MRRGDAMSSVSEKDARPSVRSSCLRRKRVPDLSHAQNAFSSSSLRSHALQGGLPEAGWHPPGKLSRRSAASGGGAKRWYGVGLGTCACTGTPSRCARIRARSECSFRSTRCTWCWCCPTTSAPSCASSACVCAVLDSISIRLISNAAVVRGQQRRRTKSV